MPVQIEFGALAAQVVHSDGLLVFLQPSFHQLAVMHSQVVEDQIHFVPFHLAH